MTRPCILLGVTADQSWLLMAGLPESLESAGWDVHLVSSPGPRLGVYQGVPGVTVHPIAMERNPSPMRDLLALWRWVRVLVRVRPDVISVGTPKAGLLGTLAALSVPKARRVYVLRGLRLETMRGHARRLAGLLERVVMRLAHHVLAVSESLRSTVIARGLVSPQKIQVLGAGSSNGVDRARFSADQRDEEPLRRLREDIGIELGVPVVGFVGRLAMDKGVLVLAAARATLSIADVDYQLLVVGGGEGESAGELLHELNRNGRTVVAVGAVHDTAPYYQLMDILVLPTYREGYPNVVLEAHASGVPVITTDATGAVDSVQPGVNGMIVPVGQADQLADALRQFLSGAVRFDPAKIVESTAPFARQAVQARLERFYRSLMPVRER